jgi:hypothetical protein
MASQDRRFAEPESHRTLIIVVSIVAAVVIVAFFYLLFLLIGWRGGTEPTLQSAIRPGSPEFDQYKTQVVMDDPEAFESKRALGDIVMTLKTTVRNLSGKTLNGLEMRAAVVDHQGKAVKERTVVVVPGRVREIPPNKTMEVPITLEGMKDSDDRANIKMEITGLTFKQ